VPLLVGFDLVESDHGVQRPHRLLVDLALHGFERHASLEAASWFLRFDMS
jgi:hypothetical protein